MDIIRLQKSDLKDALDLVWNVFLEFEAPDYSENGIQEFRNFISYHSIVESYEKGELEFWGCTHTNEIVGVISTRGKDHICLLFVKKEYHGQGIARSLFETVKKSCIIYDSHRMTVNSSPYATEVYHRLGFVDTDEEKTVNGIKFTPMALSLK